MNILENKQIILRALEPEDLNFLFQTENDSGLWEVSETQKPFSKYILQKYLENSHQDIYEAKQLRLVIVKKDSGENIGMIDLFDFNPKHMRAGIGIVILKEFRNKGFAGEALQTFINYSFNVIGLHQIYANIPLYNKESILLFEKVNFKRTGILKEWIMKNGHYKDVAFYQLLKK